MAVPQVVHSLNASQDPRLRGHSPLKKISPCRTELGKFRQDPQQLPDPKVKVGWRVWRVQNVYVFGRCLQNGCLLQCQWCTESNLDAARASPSVLMSNDQWVWQVLSFRTGAVLRKGCSSHWFQTVPEWGAQEGDAGAWRHECNENLQHRCGILFTAPSW